jgi:pseudaminic acid synthase
MPKEDSVFIIAELSANHNNSFKVAEKTIKAIAESGADAVKFQTFTMQIHLV